MEINNKTAPVTGQQDQNTISLDLMSRMKLHGMAEAFRESLAGTTPQSMTADTFLSMLLAREWDYRAQAAIVRLTRNAAFRYKAYLEQIDYATNLHQDFTRGNHIMAKVSKFCLPKRVKVEWPFHTCALEKKHISFYTK